MPTITLRLELHKPTEPKQQMYQQMTEWNTNFANWLLLHPDGNKATSKIFREFSKEKFPSAVVNQTIREVKSQKKNQKAKTFRKAWCGFNNQNMKVEKGSEYYTVSFPALEKRIGVPVVAQPFQIKWLEKNHRWNRQTRGSQVISQEKEMVSRYCDHMGNGIFSKRKSHGN
jgi:putative transposase